MIDPTALTNLLNRAADGDEDAAREVYPLIYDDLRAIATRARKKVASGETLRTTALVNEAYLRLDRRNEPPWAVRAHYFFAAARAMRDIIVDDFRRKQSLKRGGGAIHVAIEDVDVAIDPDIDVLDLNDALSRLETLDNLGYRIAMLRYFAGLSVPEVADVLETSPSTIERKWRYLRGWFRVQLDAGASE